MIIYDLICDQQHGFEGWFKDQEDLRSQQDSGMLACPICGSLNVSKRITASRVTRKSNSRPSKKEVVHKAQQVVSADPKSPEKYAELQKMLGKVHEYVEQNFEDVGNKFAEKAIKMHKGDEEHANIRGIASKDQVKEMAKEGVQAVPLPPKPVDPEKLN